MLEDRLRRLTERFDRLAEEDDWRMERARARRTLRSLLPLCDRDQPAGDSDSVSITREPMFGPVRH